VEEWKTKEWETWKRPKGKLIQEKKDFKNLLKKRSTIVQDDSQLHEKNRRAARHVVSLGEGVKWDKVDRYAKTKKVRCNPHARL